MGRRLYTIAGAALFVGAVGAVLVYAAGRAAVMAARGKWRVGE